MVRVLHLLGHTPDFETERGVDTLTQRIGANFPSLRRTIGPGGDFRFSLLASFSAVEWLLIVFTPGRNISRIAAIAAGAKESFSARRIPRLQGISLPAQGGVFARPPARRLFFANAIRYLSGRWNFRRRIT